VNLSKEQLQRGLPWGKGVQVLKLDKSGLFAVDKPAGLMTHPNKPSDQRKSLIHASYDLEKEAYVLGDGTYAYVLHRLDSATSGVLLLTLDEVVARTVRGLFCEQKIRKKYCAIVKGIPSAAPEIWSDRIEKHHKNGKMRMRRGQGVLAKTQIKLRETREGHALLDLMPITGRTHQLRIQCALNGHPILGDKTYGDFAWNREFAKKNGIKRLCLHACSVGVEDRSICFEAISPLPSCFLQPTL